MAHNTYLQYLIMNVIIIPINIPLHCKRLLPITLIHYYTTTINDYNINITYCLMNIHIIIYSMQGYASNTLTPIFTLIMNSFKF